jgi:hypothetical protein
VPQTSDYEQEVFTISEFCLRNRISRVTLIKLCNAGRGPRIMRLLGHIGRVSIEAERDWRKAMEEYAASDAQALEQVRRVKQCTEAGKIAASKENHISAVRRRKTAAKRAAR